VRSSRSRPYWPGRDAHPLLVGDFAVLCAPIEESRGVPILYLRGISSGDFAEALSALLGKDAGGLSASTIARLKDVWADEYQQWEKRDLSAKRYVYLWADGIYVQARLEDDAQCLLVIIGATPEGKKEFIGLTDGVRESAQSWRELLLDLRRRGLTTRPKLAVADGALGFWQALEEVWPNTCGQRCWVHKTANVLNKLPKSQQPKAKSALQEIWMAETKCRFPVFCGLCLVIPNWFAKDRTRHRWQRMGQHAVSDRLRAVRAVRSSRPGPVGQFRNYRQFVADSAITGQRQRGRFAHDAWVLGSPSIHQLPETDTKKDSLKAFDAFIETYGVKYDKAVECLTKDREALLAFYDFPAEHWKHLRTSNPIESTFATVRHRTVRTKGCLSNKTALAMIFKLAQAAEKSWRRLDGQNQLPKVILNVKFNDGIEVVQAAA
jgi:transposase-like protein